MCAQEWAPSAVPLMARKVEGPPHVGRREDLLKTNKELHKMLEGKVVECQHAERIIEELGIAREKERGHAERERLRLSNEVADLHAELSRQRQDALDEKARLETELTMVRSELSACSARLAKTHEALGISAEKASMLERSQGRLQIDLHGTLTTLEEASRRHKAEQAEHQNEAAQREADLKAQLEASQAEASELTQKLEAATGHGARLRHELAKTQVDADRTQLHLKHQIERLAERIEAAEGRRLDPSVLANVKFAKSLLIAPPKGRLQQTVPPTAWASPAPL